MKKIILLTVLLFAIVQFSVAQNTIAKLKFEEAEEAYASNNFELTLTKLKEVETLLKSTNPRLMHLKILAKNKLIQQPKYSNDPELISQLNKDCALYLTDYESLENNEDKYREVYKISEAAKEYKYDEILYKKADAGDADSQFYLGNFYLEKNQIYPAIKWFEKSANQGVTGAMQNLGWVYKSKKMDFDNSFKWYQTCANKGDRNCIVVLAKIYRFGENVPKNIDKALEYFNKAAELGHIESLRDLGSIYRDGKLVQVNGNKAIEYYSKAILLKPENDIDKRILSECCINIGRMYFEGGNIEKNYSKAEEFANKAIQFNNENGAALILLGQIYRIGGYGIVQNYYKAFNYFNESLSKGEYALNLICLAEMYQKGLGTNKNKPLALELSNKSVKLYTEFAKNVNEPSLSAAIKLAEIYEQGIGCDKDISRAEYWRAEAIRIKEKEKTN
jgi:TPR repeat protein